VFVSPIAEDMRVDKGAMLQFLATSPTFDEDHAANIVRVWIEDCFAGDEGTCYYKHPAVLASSGELPDLSVLTRGNQPLIIKCLDYQLDDIESIDGDTWIVRGIATDSPLLDLDDFVVGLRNRIEKDRTLRRRLAPRGVLALPLIPHSEFERRFPGILEDVCALWAGGDTGALVSRLAPALSDIEWRLTRAVFQGVAPLNKLLTAPAQSITTQGAAIKELERQIALLDEEQEKGALQIAPGPQRLRGLAGTGKTVLLAMKAANIHLRYPDKKILFTFHTQSLYNQAERLISKFYRSYSDADPDWQLLHVRHGWGGRNRPGVYFDVSTRQGVPPLTFAQARAGNASAPLAYCCQSALGRPIEPEYDFILVDEAQDFPKEFFHMLFKLSRPPHRIYWAYDELQQLTSIEIPRPEDLFGTNEGGLPLVSLDGDDYPGSIEKDLVLHRSYRCPEAVLMLAHAIGLGLYSPQGCIQMLADAGSWESIGYEVQGGQLHAHEPVTIYRPSKNSPNPIARIYDQQKLVTASVFESRGDELEWVAESIAASVQEQDVPPEHILAISLDGLKAKSYLTALQSRLQAKGIASTIPGVSDDVAAFAEQGKVTLSTIYRAKGNEAAIVHILSTTP